MTSWLNRLWKMFTDFASTESKPGIVNTKISDENYDKYHKELLRATHEATKQVAT